MKWNASEVFMGSMCFKQAMITKAFGKQLEVKIFF